MSRDFFEGKVVLVTGGSSGIGKELLKQLLARGAWVAITGRHQHRLDRIVSEFGNGEEKLLCVKADMRQPTEVEDTITQIIEKFGALDALITNAGISGMARVDEASTLMMKEVIDTNLYGTLFPIMAALPELKKSKGRILMISSLAGLHGLPNYSAYSIGKSSLRALFQSLRTELKGSNVKVCLSYVGFTSNETEKTMLNQNGTPIAAPQRSNLFCASRQTTASRLLYHLEMGFPVLCTNWPGEFYRVLTNIFPGAINLLMRLLYRNKFSINKSSPE